MDNPYAKQKSYYYPDTRTFLNNLLYTIAIATFIAIFLTLTGIFIPDVT